MLFISIPVHKTGWLSDKLPFAQSWANYEGSDGRFTGGSSLLPLVIPASCAGTIMPTKLGLTTCTFLSK
jgi:hypothetical protein